MFSAVFTDPPAGVRVRMAWTAALTVVFVLAFAFVASDSQAAATLNVTTDSKASGSDTSMTLNTEVTGWSSQRRQYGAEITVPATYAISAPAFGSTAQRCPANAFSNASLPVIPGAQAFDPTGCPAEAKIGTATLGNATGSIYFVEASPLPQMGVYFDAGVSTPYGRKLELTYPSGNAAVLRILGLQNTPTSGLTLDFENPSRPSLPKKIWRIVSGPNPDCSPNPNFSGTVYIWPPSYWPWASTQSVSDSVEVTGCGSGFSAVASNPTAGSHTPLKLSVPLNGSGYDTRMYGTQVTLPPSIAIPVNTDNFGSSAQMCSAGSFDATEFPDGQYVETFDNSSCPADAVVGTVKLGSVTGSIYAVDVSPIPDFGVYFDSGTGTPFGVRLHLTYSSTGGIFDPLVTKPVLTVMGLPNVSTNGLEIDFNNPSRPNGLNAAIWKFHHASDPNCGPGYPTNILVNWLESDDEVDVAAYHSTYMPLSGCS